MKKRILAAIGAMVLAGCSCNNNSKETDKEMITDPMGGPVVEMFTSKRQRPLKIFV